MIRQFSAKQISYTSDALPADLQLLCFNSLIPSRSQASSLGARVCLRKRNAISWLQAALAGQEAGIKVSEGKKNVSLL